MKSFLLIVSVLTVTPLFSQLHEEFTDGDFTNAPTWGGTVADFIVNPSFELQLNNSVAATSYLSTPHNIPTIDGKEWRFYVKQSFSPSGGNYGRVYLTSDVADLTNVQNGFYLQFGEAGTNDAVRLIKVDSGTETELIAGTAGEIATSFQLGVRVVRDNSANWSLYIDNTGGTNYTMAGTANDATLLIGTHFGFLQVYTSSNSNKFYYDNIHIEDEVIDVNPPTLVSATAVSATSIDVLFDEPLDQVSAELISNYDIQPFLSATSAIIDGVNPALVHIVPTAPLTNGMSYTLFTNNIEDVNGNVSASQSVNFSYLVAENPAAGDVVINEFLCDPTPVVGLKESEFVEVYNRSNKILNLNGWKLGDNSSFGTIQNGWLMPNDYIVLTPTSSVDSFAVATGVTSFPSLNNSDDAIVLYDDNGNFMDSIYYTSSWYHDTDKDDGGYTIERINPDDPCSDISNWSASNDVSGGTPGTQNSNYNNTPDTEAPSIVQVLAYEPSSIEVYFNEGLDAGSVTGALISTNPNLTVQNVSFTGSFPTVVNIDFNEAFEGSQTYALEIQNIADCWLNTTNLNSSFVLAEQANPGDIVINEIMFDPLTGGSDWIELYNNSDKLIDLFEWQVAKNASGAISDHKTIQEHYLLPAGDYVVITENEAHIIQNYRAAVIGKYIEMDIPSYNNDSSTIYLIDNQVFPANNVIDKVSYQSDWHFKLIDKTKGKSLERIDINAGSDNRNNWHTAAEAVGFATPGGENSQYRPALSNGAFSYSSETISPDNDGMEDVLQINYEMAEAGYIGNFTIYDDRGRKVATVFESELLASHGTFIWDGVRDDNTKASIGLYVGVFEAFNIDGGSVFSKRKAFVVAGRL